ncbi:MAG: invasion associated locus B family protein [Pseudomonadota bacterium]
MTGHLQLVLSRTALALALVAAPLSVVAQENDQSEDIASDLALGEQVDETRQVGDSYIKEEFSDWAMRCIVSDDENDPCQMYQLLTDQQGSPIAEVTLFPLPEGSQAVAAMNVIVPLETALQQQLTIKVDESQALRYPYALCNTVGCYARIGLQEEQLSTYRNGSAAVLTIIPFAAQDQRVQVTMSLSGFTAAFDALSAEQQ